MRVCSMTGYGKGVCERDGQRMSVEIRSVNHRFLDLAFKMPKNFLFAEDALRKRIKDAVGRGHLDVYVNYEDRREHATDVQADAALAQTYYRAAGEIALACGIDCDMSVSELMRMPDVLTTRGAEADETQLAEMIGLACDEALVQLDAMREREGALLVQDLLGKSATIVETVRAISKFAPDIVEQHRAKVRKRISEFLQATQIDEARMLNEIAFYSDKVCIDEETTRLLTHTEHFDGKLRTGGAVGKQLDFLIQEMNRESNTIASKCCDIRVSELAISLKNTIEMMREQIQNLE